jgi:hypothetical protein
MITVVYRYGVASWWRAPEWISEQLRLGHNLDNDLVSVAYEHEEAKAAHWTAFPQIAVHEAALATAETEAVDLFAHVKQVRGWLGKAKHDKDKLRAAELRVDLAAAQADLRAVKAGIAALKLERRTSIADVYEQSTEALAALSDDRKAKIGALYGRYCGSDGAEDGSEDADVLHWASFNAAVKHHETARQRMLKARGAGQAAQLHYHRWDGTGAVTVQLMRHAWSHGCAPSGPPWPCNPDKPRPKAVDCPNRQAKDPARSPQLLAAGGGKWANVFQLSPWSRDPVAWKRQPRTARRGTATLTLSGGRRLEVPVLVDRVLPATADVPQAQLVRSEVAGRMVWHLCVTAILPDPEPVTTGPTVAVHLGWRRRPDGHVRAGVVLPDGPLPPPPADLLRAASSSPGRTGTAPTHVPHHRPFLERHDGWWEVVIPGPMWDIVGRPSAIRARRDLAFNEIRDVLVRWLDEHPEHADPLGLDLARVKLWRVPRALAGLVRRWASDAQLPALFAAQLLPDLVAWWRRDLHLYRYEVGERHDLAARRDDVWGQIGAWLGRSAGRVLVGDEDYRALRRRTSIVDDDMSAPTERVDEAVRARAAFAVPGLLRAALTNGASRRGVTVAKVPAAWATREHHECGHVATGDDDQYRERIVVTCPGCQVAYDQDRNAVLVMLERERAGSTGAKGDRSQP